MRYLFAALFLMLGMNLAPALASAQSGPQSPIPVLSGSSNYSANWAGYVAEGQQYTAVSGNWQVPTVANVAATKSAADATWVGIGGVESRDLIQAGTQAIVQNGAIVYQAWVETLPNYSQTIPLTIHAGDFVSVSLHETSTNVWQLNFYDTTTNASYQTSINYVSSHSSADWIEEMPLGSNGTNASYLPLDSFGAVNFSEASTVVGGVSESASSAGAQPLTMAVGQSPLATPSSIGSDGESFTVMRSSLASTPATTTGFSSRNRAPTGVQGFVPHSRTTRVTPAASSTPSATTVSVPFVIVRFGNASAFRIFLR